MGVVSNKVDIELLKIHNDVGSLDARVTAIEDVDLPKVYSSISEITDVELPKVYSSISAVSDLILEPVTGLEDRVEAIETGSEIHLLTVTADGIKTYSDLLLELKSGIKAVYDNLSDGKILELYTLYDGLGSGTSYGTYLGLRNPFIKGTDNFSGSLRFGDIISNSGVGGFNMTITSYYISTNAVVVKGTLKDDNTIIMANTDLTAVITSGRTAYIRYRIF